VYYFGKFFYISTHNQGGHNFIEWSFCCNTYFLSEEGSINASDVSFGFANQENATESDKKIYKNEKFNKVFFFNKKNIEH